PELAAIMCAQSLPVFRDRLDQPAIAPARRPLRDLLHQAIDILELPERGPARVVAAPARARLQPDGKCFGEILGRVALRIPVTEMQDIAAAPGARRVIGWVALRRRAEHGAPVTPVAQAVGGI